MNYQWYKSVGKCSTLTTPDWPTRDDPWLGKSKPNLCREFLCGESGSTSRFESPRTKWGLTRDWAKCQVTFILRKKLRPIYPRLANTWRPVVGTEYTKPESKILLRRSKEVCVSYKIKWINPSVLDQKQITRRRKCKQNDYASWHWIQTYPLWTGQHVTTRGWDRVDNQARKVIWRNPGRRNPNV